MPTVIVAGASLPSVKGKGNYRWRMSIISPTLIFCIHVVLVVAAKTFKVIVSFLVFNTGTSMSHRP